MVEELYNDIMNNGITKIKNDGEHIDYWIDNSEDHRMGLALLIRPSQEIQDNILNIENKIKEIEPNQYFYQKEQYHITLLDFITARQNYVYSKEDVNIYNEITENALEKAKKFKIYFKGLVISDGAIMVKGYYEDELNKIRESLRQGIEDNGLKNDERYTTISSHITIARFREKIQNREKLIEFVNDYKDYYFGELEVSKIEFLYHNWYDSKKELMQNYSIPYTNTLL